MPFGSWLNGPLAGTMEEALSADVVWRRGWFEPGTVARVRQLFIEGKSGWAYPWLLMIAELWAQNVLDHD